MKTATLETAARITGKPIEVAKKKGPGGEPASGGP